MSRSAALDNINLKPCSRWAHTEYSLDYHTEYLKDKIGECESKAQFNERLNERFEIDFHWSVNGGLVDWNQAGRVTDMGHAAYAADGSDQRAPVESPFHSMEEVWEFDAVEEYGLPSADEQIKHYQGCVNHARTHTPNQLTTGGYYDTMVSGALRSFGWDMLLLGCSDLTRMEKVFDSFFRRTRFFMEAWAKTDVEVIIQHDDFVWTAGAFLSPDFYRKCFLKHYKELWKPLKAAGKKVLFCSDGDYTVFAEDVIAAGADGLIFEPCMDFGWLADEFGKDTCLVGSAVDCRDLTFEKWDKVRSDIDLTFEKLQNCNGAIVAVGNHLPANIPPYMLDKYFDYMLPKLNR